MRIRASFVNSANLVGTIFRVWSCMVNCTRDKALAYSHAKL